MVIAIGVMLLALVMIPVSRGDAARIAQNAKAIEGQVTRVEESKRSATASGSNTTQHTALIWVTFIDPHSGARLEKSWPIQYAATAGELTQQFPVGGAVKGFYEADSPHVLLIAELPDPDQNLGMLLGVAAGAVLIAGLSGFVLYRRRVR